MKHRILLVEDDESLSFLLCDSLENYGFQVAHSTNGTDALALFPKHTFDLCVLDVMLPEMDGFTLAKRLRQLDPNIPIVFLTAKSMKEDKIKGFTLGADDYITKPFTMEVFLLRLKAILKRGKVIKPETTTIAFDCFSLDLTNLLLITPKKTIQLTQRETDVLALFLENQNVLLRREAILRTIWDNDSYLLGRSLDVFISKLRKHFKDYPKIQIRNIHGTGYKLITP